MTSVEMRGNALFRRNDFATEGNWQVPMIYRQEIDLETVKLIAYSDTKSKDTKENKRKGVHFFIDDYRFEGIYRNPEKSLGKLSQYKFLLTPDYSTYADMHYWRQLESVAHSRWVGAYWQDQGQIVIPTISWGDYHSFEFCYDGIEKHSIVAVGMIGCKRAKKEFLTGYNEMLKRIDPDAIICFGTPFLEMDGFIIPVDYYDSRRAVR